VVYDGNNSWLY